MSRKESPLLYHQCTDLQRRCWDTLAEAIDLDPQHVYSCGNGIRTSIQGEAATHDSGLLTSLVLLAHRDCVRIAITSVGARRIGITAHPRDPLSQRTSSSHPSLDDLIRWSTDAKPPEPAT